MENPNKTDECVVDTEVPLSEFATSIYSLLS